MVAILVILVSASTVLAYFSASASQSSNLTVGEVKISLAEPAWNAEYASGDQAHMTPYVNGFIKDPITVSCDKNPCEGGNHNVTLYAVWKRTPRVKTYTLKFDVNGGENSPADITQEAIYDTTDARNSRSFTLTNQQIADAGMKNKKDGICRVA